MTQDSTDTTDLASQLAKESFSPTAFLTNILKDSHAEDQGDVTAARVSNVLQDLQRLQTGLMEDLDRCLLELDEQVPHVQHDLSRLQSEFNAWNQLMERMQKLWEAEQRQHVQNAEGEADPIHALMKDHAMKREIETSLNKLRDLEKWKMLPADVDKAMEQGEWKLAVKKVSEAIHDDEILFRRLVLRIQNSAVEATLSTDYQERLNLLQSLQTRLESAMNPLLIQAMNESKWNQVQEFWSMYADIGLISSWLEAFQKSRQLDLDSTLDSTVPSVSDDPVKAYKETMESFFVWTQKEFTHCQLIFDNTDYNSSQQLIELLNIIWNSRVQKQKALPDKMTWSDVIACFHSTERFSLWVEQLVHAADTSASSLELVSIFTPFETFFSKTRDNEAANLVNSLMPSVSPDANLTDVSQQLSEWIPRAIGELDNSYERCIQWTHGFGIDTFVQSWNKALTALIKNWQKMITNAANGSSAKSRADSVDSRLESSDEDLLDKFSGLSVNNAESTGWRLYVSFYQLYVRLLETESRLRQKFQKFWTAKNQNESNSGSREIADEDSYLIMCGTVASEKFIRRFFSSKELSPNCLFQPLLPTLLVVMKDMHQLFIQQLFQPIQKHLTVISQLRVWSTEADSHKKALTAFEGLDVPTFSLSPSAEIHRVGEYLLMLPQSLETFASTSNDDDRSRGNLSTDALALGMTIDKLGGLPTESQHGNHDPYEVTHFYLTLISFRTLQFFLHDQILKIAPQTVTTFGCRQIICDLDYLQNVLSALDIQAEESAAVDLQQQQPSAHMNEQLASNVLHQLFSWFTVDPPASDSKQPVLSSVDYGLKQCRAVWQVVSGKPGAAAATPPVDVQKVAQWIQQSTYAKRSFVAAIQIIRGGKLEF